MSPRFSADLLSGPELVAGAASLLTIHFLWAVYNEFSRPPHVPGPLLNRLTIWPLRLAVIKGQRVHYVDALHKKYGPVVRISPEEISIADVAAVKEIHRIGGGFLKAPWYSKFTQEAYADERELGIFAMRDPKIHSARRKLFANGFSKSALAAWEPVIHERLTKAVDGMAKNLASTGKTDILAWLTFMANDVISTLAFGQCLSNIELGQKTQYIKDLEAVMLFSGVSAELSWLSPVLQLLSPNKRLAAKGRQMLKWSRESGVGNSGNTIFDKMMAAGDSETLSQEQIAREASNLLIAGSDTTARTLTYLIWAVLDSSDASILDRLLAELEDLPATFTYQDMEGLSFLTCVTQEALRLYGAAPGGLPRTVPKSGRKLAGYFMPEETVVSSQAFTLHRDPEVFPDPLEFRPDRWANISQEMKDAFMPFGAGSRICIGVHLAQMELAVGAAIFFRRLGRKIKPAPETTPESMELENHFLVGPKSHKCIIAEK